MIVSNFASRLDRQRRRRRRRLGFECLEFRRVLASTTIDFSVAGASQFGLGRAVYEDEVFLGVDRFDTGNFNIDLFDDALNAGVKANFGLSGKAGLNVGYYVNAGSIDLAYEDVTLSTDYEDADNVLDTITIDPNINFGSGSFETQSPTLGAYVDLVLQAATRGSLTGQAPWPFEHIGGTVNLNHTLVDVNQELLSFNRDGSNQLRLLGEDFPVGGVEINLPVSAAPPTSISIAAAQLSDEDGNAMLGVEAAATLSVSNLADHISPKSVKKGPDQVDNVQSLKDRARQIANSPLSVELGTMQLNVPQISLSQQLSGAATPSGTMSANNANQRELENLIAGLNLNLGLKDLSVAVGPASISITPFNFQISPSLYATQTITVTPISTVIYTFDSPVSGSVHRDSGGVARNFSEQRLVEVDASEQLRLNYAGRPFDVSADWRFRAQVDNQITINASLGGKLTVGDLKIDADLPQWIKDIVGLPYDPRPLYENGNLLSASLGSFTIDVPSFDIIDRQVALDPLSFGKQALGSLRVDHNVDEVSANGLNSLREAMIYADNNGVTSEQVIYLDAETYTLSLTNGPTPSSRNDLHVERSGTNLRIVGKGPNETIIDANGIDRVIEVFPGARLTLEDLQVTGGKTWYKGGGVYALGRLDLINVNLVNNESETSGGGAYMAGGGTILESNINNNIAGVISGGAGSAGHGGGISVTGMPITVQQTAIFQNTAMGDGGGVVATALATFVSSTIAQNSAIQFGSAIYADRASIRLFASTITDNESTWATEAVYVSGPSSGSPRPELWIRDTIIAGNKWGDIGPVLFDEPLFFTVRDSDTKNLIGSTRIDTWGAATIHGTPENPIDPRLNRHNQSSDFIYILMFDSPAIGGGTGDYLDQRGQFPTSANDPYDVGAAQFLADLNITPSDVSLIPIAIETFIFQGGPARLNLEGGVYKMRDSGSTKAMEVFGVDENFGILPVELTISGLGREDTIIDASGYETLFGVFDKSTLNLENLTIQGDKGRDNYQLIFVSGTLGLVNVKLDGHHSQRRGGAIHVFHGNLTIANSVISNNTASRAGGAIYFSSSPQTSDRLLIVNSIFEGNRVEAGEEPFGGAIALSRGNAEIRNSQFIRNSAGVLDEAVTTDDLPAKGGAVWVGQLDASLLVDRSLISENQVLGGSFNGTTAQHAFGGGIYSAGVVTISDSTIVQNVARGGNSGVPARNGGDAQGGGVFIAASAGPTLIESSTIVRNRLQRGLDGQGTASESTALGGGIWVDDNRAPRIVSSVVAENNLGTQHHSLVNFPFKDVRGIFDSLGHNFIGVADQEAGFDEASDRYGLVTNINPEIGDDLSQFTLDPMLSELGNFGGPIPVMVPLLGSPLIDNGNPANSGTDQRGMPRVIGPQADIGAAELDTLFVSTTEDRLDQRSLRQAMIDANILSQHGSTVDIRLDPGVYVLDRQGHDDDNLLGSLDVKTNKKIRIFGAGAGETVIDSRDVANKTFDVFAGSELTLEGLTIYGSTTNPHLHAARAIASFGTLFISDTHITGARTGAAIRNGNSGTLIVERSSFTDNQNLTGTGGAILNDGHMTIRQSSFANNVASQGAAITQRGGSAVLQRVTIAGNEATTDAGGIANLGGTFTLIQSIVADNTGENPNLVGQLQSQGNNLIGQISFQSGFLASDQLNIDPLLEPLSSDAPLPYFDLQLTSPALDQGVKIPNLTTDQLGRPAWLGNSPDIGAIESLVLHVFRVDDLPEIGTLRYAVTMANQHPGMDTITFDELAEPVLLGGSPLQINQSVTLNGHHSGQTTVDADGRSRVFEIGPNAHSVNISLLIITGGSTSGNGAGIYAETADVHLQITDSHITENHAEGNGGGIYSPGGSVEIEGTSLTFNTAAHGAGVHLEAPPESPPGHFLSHNSTFSSNAAGGTAGAVGLANATGSLTHTTIAENQAEADGGGAVFGAETAVTIQNSIVANNHTQGNAPDMWWSPEDTHFFVEYSLIGENSGTQLPESTVGSSNSNGNIVGSASGQGAIDPMLGGLYDNGGATPTLTPESGSAAVGAASGAQTTSRDQRGLVRDSSTADMGAVEVQEVQNFATAPTRSISKQAIEGSRLQVSYIYKDFARTEIFAAPEVTLNLLPWASPVEAQEMMEGTTLQQIPIEVGDFELEEAGELDSIQITASSSNPSIIPDDQIVISGSGENRFITIMAAENAVDSPEVVTINLTLNDGIGTNTVSFPVTVLEARDVYLADLEVQDVRIARNGAEIEFYGLSANGDALLSLPLADINGLRVYGRPNTVNSIEIDYASGGLFDFPFGLSVNGGEEADDQLTMVGSGTARATYRTTAVPTVQPEFVVEESEASALIRYVNFDHFVVSGFAEFIPEAALTLDTGSFSLDVGSPVTLPSLTVLNGATLNSTTDLVLPEFAKLRGYGHVNANFTSEHESELTLTGDLDFGSPSSKFDFVSDGRINLHESTLSIFNENAALIGGSISLDLAESSGRILVSGALQIATDNVPDLTVNITGESPPAIDDVYRLISAEESIQGEFTSTEIPAPPLGAGWHLAQSPQHIELGLRELATVNQVIIGDDPDSLQRSRVSQIKVMFDGAVEIDDDAFEVRKRGPEGGIVASTFVTQLDDAGNTIATLAFVDSFTRGSFNSLVDGNYQLTIDSAKVRLVGTQLLLDGNQDGVSGGSYLFGTSAVDRFFALYGDSDGDRDVDGQDLQRFAGTFRKRTGQSGFVPSLDHDGDGDVDGQDLQQFALRFRSRLGFE